MRSGKSAARSGANAARSGADAGFRPSSSAATAQQLHGCSISNAAAVQRHDGGCI